MLCTKKPGGSNPNPKQEFVPAENPREEAGESYSLGLGLRKKNKDHKTYAG